MHGQFPLVDNGASIGVRIIVYEAHPTFVILLVLRGGHIVVLVAGWIQYYSLDYAAHRPSVCVCVCVCVCHAVILTSNARDKGLLKRDVKAECINIGRRSQISICTRIYTYVHSYTKRESSA